MSQANPVESPTESGTEHRSPRPVVDLRDVMSAGQTRSSEPTLHAGEQGESVSGRSTPGQRRAWVIFGAVAFVILFLADGLIGHVSYDAHQRHLAYDLTQPIEEIALGGALLNLQIPSLGVNEIVVEGASAAQLRGGLGRVEGTADIGSTGNTVVIGRRTRYGEPFAQLGEVDEGATVAVQTRQTEVRLYAVEKVERLEGNDRGPLEVTDEERLTLVTSGGGYFSDDRVVVTAVPKDGSTPSDPERERGGELPLRSLDQRPASPIPGGLLVWSLLAGLVVLVVAAARWLRHRYSVGAVLVALAPIGALLALILMYSVDILLPSTV